MSPRGDALRAAGLLVLAVLGFAAPTATRADSTVPRSVVANGGSTASGGGHILSGTVGQAVIGISSGAANMLCAGFWCSGLAPTVAVDPTGLPPRLAFAAPAPNPAEAAVRLTVELPAPGRIGLTVFDAAGRRVKGLVNQDYGAGAHAWNWDLRSDAGERVAAGVYFSRLVVNQHAAGSRRIVVIR